jgi:hypothetical protein
VACAVGVVGAAGVVAVGPIQNQGVVGPLMNALAVVMAVVFCGSGVRAIQAPTTIRLAQSAGTDAWGNTQFGPSHNATASEGRRTGVTHLIVGSLLLLLGIVLGRIIH